MEATASAGTSRWRALPEWCPSGPDRDGSRLGIVVVGNDRWSDVRFARHQLVARLAKRFPVVWMNPPHLWQETPRRLFRSAGDPSCPADGPIVHDARLWTPLAPGRAGLWTTRQRLKAACRALDAAGCNRRVLYALRPNANLLDCGVPFDLTCYHIFDEYFPRPDDVQDPHERAFMTRVDRVFVHSRAILERKRHLNPRTEWVPNGVDYPAYAAPRPEPADLAPIPRPRIGYSGHVKPQLDWALLLELAGRHPEWSFVFVGELKRLDRIQDRVKALQRLPNVHFLGRKTFDQLAGYPRHFDVCTMPYTLDHYTRYIYPLKLHEYHAAGRPIVSTPVPAVRPFAATVALAEGVDEWSRALRRSLAPENDTAERRAARRAVARDYDWELLAARIADTLARGIRHPIRA